ESTGTLRQPAPQADTDGSTGGRSSGVTERAARGQDGDPVPDGVFGHVVTREECGLKLKAPSCEQDVQTLDGDSWSCTVEVRERLTAAREASVVALDDAA